MQAYGEEFARIYDLRWGRFARYVGPRIVDFYNGTDLGAREPRILDLCCGAGHLSYILLAEGFLVHGIDLSPAMIRHARTRNRAYIEANTARFDVGDARDFNVAGSFGLVVSTFDALNHLESLDELEAAFRRVLFSLVEDGYFMFDINTRKGLESWNGIEVDESPDLTIINRGVFGEGMDRAYTRVSGFYRTAENTYRRFEETVYNTVFAVDDVLNRLAAVGFTNLRVTHDSDFSVDITSPEEQARLFFIARKR